MRTKILLFLTFLISGFVNAQVNDTIYTVIISEVRLDDARRGYIEIANIGADPVNLDSFEIGKIGAWTAPWTPGSNNEWRMLPNYVLDPGKTFIIAGAYDFNPEMYLAAPEDYDPNARNKSEFATLANIQLHFDELTTGNPVEDSVTPGYQLVEFWSGRDCVYLRYHVGGDSGLVDQVNGIWRNGTSGTRPNAGPVDVAGVTGATGNSTLVRKFSVTQGTIDFAGEKGEDLSESQWIPIPHQAGGRWADNVRRLFWTAGFHGNAVLGATTLVPKAGTGVTIDYAAGSITVPWGTRRDDSIMFTFERVPGLAWHYHYKTSYADSACMAAKTGDSLTVYATGNELTWKKFGIIVNDPTTSVNIVVPKKAPNNAGHFNNVDDPVYFVSTGNTVDTITSLRFGGIPFATRVDTLQKYLEKPANATWEVIWKNETVRTDLQHGDVLRVKANNGTTKDYFIKVDQYRKSHNANLSSITWPDIPADFKGLFGWMGDTIANFVPTKLEYAVKIPASAGIPAIIGKNQNLNGRHKVIRATNLNASVAERTMTFISTAEDDTTINEYKVQLLRQKETVDIQPYSGDPFISELVFRDQWSDNSFLEIVNPRPLSVDLSDYMFVFSSSEPATAIQSAAAPENWLSRYTKYIPGYKWVDSATWQANPATVVPDLNIDPNVAAGDVFVMADVRGTGQLGAANPPLTWDTWWAPKQCDVIFSNNRNPWDERVGPNLCENWLSQNYYMFKILNDSIKAGTKAATDPNDFLLIDALGDGDNTPMDINGAEIAQIQTYIRKPGIYKGNATLRASAGTNAENSEWIMRNQAYYDDRQAGWPYNILNITEDVGTHFMDEVTVYKSTISSAVYKVSDGYGNKESIKGVAVSTDVTNFLTKIVKADAAQTLTLKSGTTGTVLTGTDIIVTGDSLIVVSADAENTTKYIIAVTALSNNAVLTSEAYTITHDAAAGTVEDFDYGITLAALRDSVIVPEGASLVVVNDSGAYVSEKMLNFDTTYVKVLVTSTMNFIVTAEDGVTQITYDLVPNSTNADAFVYSSVFNVDQFNSLISYIPTGISVREFVNQLIPSAGATIKVLDKLGFERLFGNVLMDDVVEVTAADGTTKRTYELEELGDSQFASFAYVTSFVYLVDQDELTITGSGITNGVYINDFLDNLIASAGATVKITTATGTEVTSGKLGGGYLLVVTSEDGTTTVTYDIDVALATKEAESTEMVVYPNPGKGIYNISGIKSGNKIQVSNILGVTVFEKDAVSDREQISIENMRNGVYFITITEAKKVIGRYKVVKE